MTTLTMTEDVETGGTFPIPIPSGRAKLMGTPVLSMSDSLIVNLIGHMPAIDRFRQGIRETPDPLVVQRAILLVHQAQELTREPLISVDEDDGDLDLDLRLANNQLAMANMFPDGSLDATIFDDSSGRAEIVETISRSPQAVDTLIGRFIEALNDSTPR